MADVSEIHVGVSAEFLDKEIHKIEKVVSTEFNRVISLELGKLYRRLSDDQRLQQTAGDAKFEAVLRLVSSTLTDNVEKSLTRIVTQGIHQSVVPAVKDVTARTLDQNLAEMMRQQWQDVLPRELTRLLPECISDAMQNPEMLRAMAILVTERVSARLEPEITGVIASTLRPVLDRFSHETANVLATDVENRVADQIDRLEARAESDSQKIESLQELVHGLTRTVSRMAAVQTEFQQEILKLQRQGRVDNDSIDNRGSSMPGAATGVGGVTAGRGQGRGPAEENNNNGGPGAKGSRAVSMNVAPSAGASRVGQSFSQPRFSSAPLTAQGGDIERSPGDSIESTDIQRQQQQEEEEEEEPEDEKPDPDVEATMKLMREGSYEGATIRVSLEHTHPFYAISGACTSRECSKGYDFVLSSG